MCSLPRIYPIGNILEKVSAYFFQDKYEIRYEYGADLVKSIEKEYMTYIEPDEIITNINSVSLIYFGL